MLVKLKDEHTRCEICFEDFYWDFTNPDDNVACSSTLENKHLYHLPVISVSKTCSHYFCYGCILKQHKATATNKKSKWIKCMTCRANTSFAPEQPLFHKLLMDLLRDGHKNKYAQHHARKDVEILSLLPNESLKADHHIQDGQIFSTYQKVTKDSVDPDRESSKDMISTGTAQSATSDEQPLSRRSEASRIEFLEATRKVYKQSQKNAHTSASTRLVSPQRRSQRVANMSRKLNYSENADFGRQNNADDENDESEDDNDVQTEDDNDDEGDNANGDKIDNVNNNESDNVNVDAIDDSSHDDSEIIFIETRSDKPIANQVNFLDPEQVEEPMYRREWCRKTKEPLCHSVQKEQEGNYLGVADSVENLHDGRLDWGERYQDDDCTRKREEATERIQDLSSTVQQSKQSITTSLENRTRENNAAGVNVKDAHEKKSSHCSISRATSERSMHFAKSKDIKKVYCGNLSPRVNETTLRRFFGACGDIVSIHFPRKPGLAFVEFGSVHGAMKAIKRDGERVKEEKIKVEICQRQDERIAIGITKKTNAGGAHDVQNNRKRLLNSRHAMNRQTHKKQKRKRKTSKDAAGSPQMENLCEDNGTGDLDDCNSRQKVSKEKRRRHKIRKMKKNAYGIYQETNAGRGHDDTDEREENSRERLSKSEKTPRRKKIKKRTETSKEDAEMTEVTNVNVIEDCGSSGHGDFIFTQKVFKEHRKERKGSGENESQKTKKVTVGITEEKHDATDKCKENNRKRQAGSQPTKKTKRNEEKEEVTNFGVDNSGGGHGDYNSTQEVLKERRKQNFKDRRRNKINKMKKSAVGLPEERHAGRTHEADKCEQNIRKRQAGRQHTQSNQTYKKKKEMKKNETEMNQVIKVGKDYRASGTFTHKDFKEHRKEKQKGRGRNTIQKMKKNTVAIPQETRVVQGFPRETDAVERYNVANHRDTKRFQGEWDANRQAYRFSKRVHIKW